MKKTFSLWAMVVMMSGTYAFAGPADIDWTELAPIQLDNNAADLVVSEDGNLMFILAKGKINVFSLAENKVIKQIKVDDKFDRLTMGKDNTLILSSGSSNTLKRIQIERVADIDIAGLPFRGPRNAPVVITVFDDYQCGFCARLNPLLDKVMEKYPKEVKLVIKHFPLRFHAYAQKAAMAALAAGNQGKFWEFHELLFKNANALSDVKVLEMAKQLNLDAERFKKDKDSEKIRKTIEKSMADGMQAGVKGTPAVYINGKFLKMRNLQGFEKQIEKELEKAPKQ